MTLRLININFMVDKPAGYRVLVPVNVKNFNVSDCIERVFVEVDVMKV